MMNYLVKIDDFYYEYETPILLRCDIMTAGQAKCAVGPILEKMKLTDGVRFAYKEIKFEDLKDEALLETK